MTHMGPQLLLVTAVVFTVGLLPSSAANHRHFCPEACHCSSQDAFPTVQCTSFNFVKKLSPKELSAIVALDVSNASLTSVDKHLVKKLVNLERLNLSFNRLSDIKHLPFLPKLTHLNLHSNLLKTLPGKQLGNIEVLDISRNYIRELPQELLKWTHLKRLYLDGNVFTCSRESLDIRDALLDRKIKIIGRPLCSSPSKFYGKSWIHAVDFGEYLKIHNQDDMLSDDNGGSGEIPDEGSGHVDPWSTTPIPEEVGRGSNDDLYFGSGDEPKYNEPEENTEHPRETTTELLDYADSEEEEDEGSGAVPPAYIDTDDVNKLPDIFTTSEMPEIKEPEISTRKTVPVYVKPVVTEGPDRVEITTEENINEAQANKLDKGSLGTNIFLVFIVLCLVALLVYFIKKKKANKRRNARQKAEDLEKQNAGIELLPKSSVVSEKQNGNPENTPLMNGQNGEIEKEIETSLTDNLNQSPVEVRKKDAVNGDSRDGLDSPQSNAPQHSPKQDILSLKTKTSEIPDSIPRTPILVDRRKTSDGQNIVVTPSPNQRISSGD